MRTYEAGQCDIAVIGAGHAGIEAALAAARGYRVVNLDTTIIAQAPKLAPYIPAMREAIARVLGIEAAAVSVKATTEEKLGFTGRGEGIAAQAVVLLEKA